MITAENYFEFAPRYVSKFNEAQKAGHDVLKDIKQAGMSLTDPDVSGGDIGDVIRLQIAEMNKLAGDDDTKPAKVVKTKTDSEDSFPEPVELPKRKAKAVTVTQQKRSPKAKKSKAAAKNLRAKAAVTKIKYAAVVKAKVSAKQLPKPAVKINKLSLELGLIRTLAGMNGKTYKLQALQNKITMLNKNFEAGTINDHVSIIKDFLKAIKTAHAKMIEQNATEVGMILSTSVIAECRALVKNAKPKLQVNYLGGVKDKKHAEKRLKDESTFFKGRVAAKK